jgi:molybdopterin-containing oxidoreductase family iron-sulfur binding subunit
MNEIIPKPHDHPMDTDSTPASTERTPITYWTSLEQLNGDPELERHKGEEFWDKPERFFDADKAAMEDGGKRPGPIMEAAGFVELGVLNNGGAQSDLSRRDFLKLSAAAMAFATAGCALRPTEKIIPYVKAPEEIVPGVANYYASTLLDAAGTGVLVKTREGRPIKIEGNPDHPLSQGKLTASGQLSIFNLYDPDRLTGPVKLTPGVRGPAQAIPWQTADAEIGKALAEAKGKVVLLTGTIHGPARVRLAQNFASAFPGGQHVMADAWSYEATRSAQEKCYGAAVLPRLRFDRAEYVLSLGMDFLGSGYSHLEWQVDFGKQRKIRDGKMAKLVVFEPFLSVTGSNSDERHRVRPADLPKIAMAIANQLLSQGHYPEGPDTASLRNAFAKYSASSVESETGLPSGTIQHVAQELWQNREQSLIVAGEAESLQIVANLLNSICGNDGRAVDGAMSPSRQSKGSINDMLDLIHDMNAGKVDALIIHGTNPAYWLSEPAGFAAAIKKVGTVISLSDRVDETANHAHYVLPGLHYLESWGDSEPQVGLYSLAQPAIYPLYDNRAVEDSLLAFMRASGKTGPLGSFTGGWHEYVMDTWKTQIYSSTRYLGTFDDFWNSALRDGVLNTITETGGDPRKFLPAAVQAVKMPQSGRSDLELVVYPSPIHGDGAFANNAWLLETPDPISHITWSNTASISPATARKLSLGEGDIVRLEVPYFGKESDISGMELGYVAIEIPIHIQPGDTDGIVSIQSGWGRTHAGRIGNDVGANAFAFRSLRTRFRPGGGADCGVSCRIKATGKKEELANVQMHSSIEGRPILYEATLEEYKHDPAIGHPPLENPPSIWKPLDYPNNRWGMQIDLSSCIGCNACVVACQVENNIPVVGREEVSKGRVMHWIRIDRYYSGEPENPDVTFQPMLCQHCENAPCETVCPVIATLHDEEGLNVQVYNRCVGTRYCSNNCPYKVRRFNWHEFAFTAYDQHPLQLVLNPDVTVREKGVMEKCTFCWQRIRAGKDQAKRFGRTVRDEDIKTACQQTCPTDAITFGNMNNQESQVAVNMKDERSFHVLQELNTRSSIAYWTKIRNRPGSSPHGSEGHHA